MELREALRESVEGAMWVEMRHGMDWRRDGAGYLGQLSVQTWIMGLVMILYLIK